MLILPIKFHRQHGYCSFKVTKPIQGKSEYEPVYVNSLTYGRLGIIAFETDESYEFAETCIKKNLIESSVRKQLL